MPLSNKLPNSLRYVRGRLRILKRPMVWGSASALLLAVILFSEYWQHPEWFTSSEEHTSTSGVASLDNLSNPGQYDSLPSQEDSAIGADIDSLPVLLNDLALDNPAQNDQTNAESNRVTQEAITPNSDTTSSLTRATTQATASPTAVRQNPFAATSQNTRLFDLNLPGIDRTNNNASAPNSSLNSGFAAGLDLLTPPTQTAQNPLQSAIQQYSSNQSQPGSLLERSPTIVNSQSTQPNTANSQTTVNQPFANGRLQPGQPIPNGLLPTTPLQTSPPLGTTGYTLPPVLRTVPSSAPNNPYSNSGRVQPVSGLTTAPQIAPSVLPQPSNIGNSTGQNPYGVNQGNLINPYNLPSSTNPRPSQAEYDAPEPEPAPFTAPHSRGGGEINTFANP